ncbi:heme biosynthesis protein HemY [Desulfopila sp. IMCC35006]|uniref:heme biosynthesis HemY N-terminal domain-containing protein n=1 Tax=Desulfopila sp. IMCC35006 TaxID=2569542 RepID=UPI0010AB6133|nr:heme biosynthesis HemY N-terminal domain-containing protein [Desulfopila sp. IMCC35006]TKB23196.1 heme biosynthesis protein HemY [Desulfopila sp. IMCC35006]
MNQELVTPIVIFIVLILMGWVLSVPEAIKKWRRNRRMNKAAAYLREQYKDRE